MKYIGYYPRFHKDNSLYGNFLVLIDKIIEFPGLVREIWQRGTRGYSCLDAWNASDYFTKVIVGVMENLREYDEGIMGALYDDCRESETTAFAIQIGIYTAIIDGLCLDNYQLMDMGNEEERNEARDKFNLGMELFVEYFECFWK